jgi:hypothetical protein
MHWNYTKFYTILFAQCLCFTLDQTRSETIKLVLEIALLRICLKKIFRNRLWLHHTLSNFLTEGSKKKTTASLFAPTKLHYN